MTMEQHVICLSPARLSKITCSGFHGFISRTVQQSMKASFFSAQSHWLSLAAIVQRAPLLCFVFACVCTIFCVLLLISGGLFRDVFAGGRGEVGLCLPVWLLGLGGWRRLSASSPFVCRVHNCCSSVWFDLREALCLGLLSLTQQMFRGE